MLHASTRPAGQITPLGPSSQAMTDVDSMQVMLRNTKEELEEVRMASTAGAQALMHGKHR